MMSNLQQAYVNVINLMLTQVQRAFNDDVESGNRFKELSLITDESLSKKVYKRLKQINEKQYKDVMAVLNQPLADKSSFENMDLFFDKPVLNEHKQYVRALSKLKRAVKDLFEKIEEYQSNSQNSEKTDGAENIQERGQAGEGNPK